MAGFEVPGEVDNMASKEADLLEDLKLMTKRMKVRVESIVENLDTILKRLQLKRQRLLRNRKRPATMHAIGRFSLRATTVSSVRLLPSSVLCQYVNVLLDHLQPWHLLIILYD